MTTEINNTKSKTNLEHFVEGGKNQRHQKPTLTLYMKLKNFLLLVYKIWSNKTHKSMVKDILMGGLKVTLSTLEFEKKPDNECQKEEIKRKRKAYSVFFKA